MELHFTPEQGAQLASLAHHEGKPLEQQLSDTAPSILNGNEAFLKAVDKGIIAADREEFIDEDEMNACIQTMLRT